MKSLRLDLGLEKSLVYVTAFYKAQSHRRTGVAYRHFHRRSGLDRDNLRTFIVDSPAV